MTHPTTCKTCLEKGSTYPEYDAVCKDQEHESMGRWLDSDERQKWKEKQDGNRTTE